MLSRMIRTLRFALAGLLLVVSAAAAQQIRDTTAPTSVDPKLIEWVNSKIVKEYTIGGIDKIGRAHV